MDKLEFGYDGTTKVLTASEDCYLTYAIIGGAGGAGANSSSKTGGKGADGIRLDGTIFLPAGEKLYCAVGAGGAKALGINGGAGGKGISSYYGGAGANSSITNTGGGGGGGGATLLWQKKKYFSWLPFTYNSYIAIAAGGGGGGGASLNYDGQIPSQDVYGLNTGTYSKQSYINGYPASGGGPAIGFGWLYLDSDDHKIRFNVGVLPILKNFKPDNCNSPTEDLIVIGEGVSQQHLTSLGIKTPIEQLQVVRSGDSISWNASYTVDHNVKIGYWIWDVNYTPTTTLTQTLFSYVYGASGRQTDSQSGTFTIPPSFTSSSVLVLGIGDVSSSGSTGMQNVYVTLSRSFPVSYGKAGSAITGKAGQGGGGGGVQGGIVRTSSTDNGAYGSAGSSLNTMTVTGYPIEASSQYLNNGIGISNSNGGDGYAGFMSFKSNVFIKNNESWVEAKDVKIKQNGSWVSIQDLKIKQGSGWLSVFKSILPSYISTDYNL